MLESSSLSGVNDATQEDDRPGTSVEEGIKSMRSVAAFLGAERLFMVGPPAVAAGPQNTLIETRARIFGREAMSCSRVSSSQLSWTG